MTRDMTIRGYRVVRLSGEQVAVYRRGGLHPSLYAASVPEALRLIEVDMREDWPEQHMDMIGHNGGDCLPDACYNSGSEHA